MVDIDKVAGLCIRARRLLVVHKRGQDRYLSLGGKRERRTDGAWESDLECLAREAGQELQVGVVDPRYFATFETVDGVKKIKLTCYSHDIMGDPRVNPADNVDGFAWVERDYQKQGILVASMLELQVIPALIERGLM